MSNKSIRSIVFAATLSLVATAGFTASAQDLKCEPDKVASKYPSLAGRTIRVAQDGESQPYSLRDPNDFSKLIGLDADMARAAFQCIGVPVEFFTGAWSGLLPAVIAGQADVMWDTLFYTPERAKKVDFVTYLSATSGGMVAQGNPKGIKSLDDVCGIRATAGLGTVEEAMFRDLSAKCTGSGKAAVELITFPDIPSGARLVQNDRADLMVSDLAMIDSIAANNPQLERTFTIATTDKKAVGLTKGDKDLAKAIQDALTILKADGTLKGIFEKYHVDYSIMLDPEILTE